MNIIAFNKAYCLYPRATLQERLSLVCTFRDDADVECVYTRYNNRGWGIIRSYRMAPGFTLDPSFSYGARWIDDGFSWSIPLSYHFKHEVISINSQTPPLVHDPVSITSWILIAGGRDITDPAAMRFCQIKDETLFYHYVMTGTDLVHTPSVATLIEISAASNAPSNDIPTSERH